MDSKSKLKSIHIKLPDEAKVEEKEDHRDSLLGGLDMPMNEVLGDDLLMRGTGSRVVIIEDTQVDEPEQEGEEIKEKGKQVKIDDIPHEDFFDTKDDEEEKSFGAISGMEEMAEDEDDENIRRASARAVRLSMYAQKFADDTEDKKAPTEIIRSPVDSQIEEPQEDVPTDDEEEQGKQDKITISEMPQAGATDSGPIDAAGPSEGLQEPRKTIDLSKLRTSSRESQISRADVKAPGSGMPSRRTSMFYDYSTRAQESDSDLMQFFDLEQQERFVLPEFEQEAEEEEIVSKAEEVPLALDREPYYNKYDDLAQKIAENRIKNNVLQKKVTMYLKRRKVENFLKDGSESPLDEIIKYNQKLDAYQEVLEHDTIERKTASVELDTLKKKRDEQSSKLKKLFKAMQIRESNVGYGLIFTKTGNAIPDKLVERLIRRQNTQMEQVSTMRLKYIKLKGMVQEKLDEIDKIDQLENNLHLADYEQLKVENRNYADKIEERDEELTRLRAKCQNTIQILAHMREKSAAFESDINDLSEERDDSESTAESSRCQLADLKHQRDRFRHLVVKIKAESGLLIEPDLLRDMEASQHDIEKLQEELEACREEVLFKTAQVRNLRKNIERRTEILNKRKLNRLKGRAESTMTLGSRSDNRSLKIGRATEEQTAPTLYKGRPTLIMPTIGPAAFKDLLKIKPNPKTSTRTRR